MFRKKFNKAFRVFVVVDQKKAIFLSNLWMLTNRFLRQLFFFMINNNDTIDLRHRGSRPLSQPFFLPLSFLPSLLATPDCFRRGLDFRDHAAFKLPFTKVSIKGSCFPAHHSLLKDSLPFQLFPAEAGTTPPPSPAIYPA